LSASRENEEIGARRTDVFLEKGVDLILVPRDGTCGETMGSRESAFSNGSVDRTAAHGIFLLELRQSQVTAHLFLPYEGTFHAPIMY
jgi:hypothetical protein